VARPEGDRWERGAGASPVFFGVRAEGQAESDGLRLAEIVVGSAAARAGLQEGDVLIRFADRPVDSFDDLLVALRGRQPGDAVHVLYVREGIEHDTSAVLDARP
jgi:putative serine protease PepD